MKTIGKEYIEDSPKLWWGRAETSLDECAILKLDALEKVVNIGPCKAPKDVTSLDSWIQLDKGLIKEYGFSPNKLIQSILPRTARMIYSEKSKPVRQALINKLVDCLYENMLPSTIEQVMREYQHELLQKPTKKQIVNRVLQVLRNKGQTIERTTTFNGVKMDIVSKDYLVKAVASPSQDAVASVVGTHYLYHNTKTNGRKKVLVTRAGEFDLPPTKEVIKELASHKIEYWGLDPVTSKVINYSNYGKPI